MSAENEREGEADGRTENKIAQVLLDSKYGDSPYVLARAILQAINFAAHQQAMQALQARVKELEGKLRLSQPPYSPVSQVKVDELVRVSWDLRNKLDAAEQRADRLQERVKELETQVEIGLQISGSFFEALKPLKLEQINVNNPGAHVTELILRANQLQAKLERYHDLVRYQRAELHEAELISDKEYAELLSDSKSVDRLHGYDELRERADRLQAEVECHAETINRLAARGVEWQESSRYLQQQLAEQRAEMQKLQERVQELEVAYSVEKALSLRLHAENEARQSEA